MTILPQRRRRRGLFGQAYDAFMYGDGARPTFVPIVSPDAPLPLSPRDAKGAMDVLGGAVRRSLGLGPEQAPARSPPAAPMMPAAQRALVSTAPAVSAAPGYTSARREGRDLATVYVRPDGSEDVYTGGTMAWRNNNPGNLKYGEFAKRHGAIGSYTNDHGTFAVFPDAATGAVARRSLLRGPSFNNLTLDQMVTRYAPPSQNDTARYQADLRRAVGVSGSTRLSELTDAQFDEMLAAIHKKEGSKAGTIARRPARKGQWTPIP